MDNALKPGDLIQERRTDELFLVLKSYNCDESMDLYRFSTKSICKCWSAALQFWNKLN